MASRRLSLLLVAVLLAPAGCGSGAAPRAAASPEPSTVEACVTPDEQRAGGVALDAGGGNTAAGVVVGTGDTGIVFANEFPDTLCGWREWAGPLEKRYRLLLFDYSGGPVDKDVLAGVAALRRHGVRKVFLVGASMGATAVLAAAPSAQPPVAGVVALSGAAGVNGVDALAGARKLTAPVLIVAARDDQPYGTDAQTLYDACPAHDKKLDLQAGGLHGRSLLDDPMSAKVEAFLAAH
jgi:pimeloyl-ACP methyl ester carboxylesterase